MLGHKMYQVLGSRFPDTYCTIRGLASDPELRKVDLLQQGSVIPDVDVTDFESVETLLRYRSPDVVVNCVGIVKQREDAQAAIPSITVNSLLPHRLADICRRLGTRLIHFSTDCVFNGTQGSYVETDPSDATDLYGRTKFSGEVSEHPALTLRSSIIGRELTHFSSLLEWFLAQDGGSVRGYRRALYSGLTTNRMAALVGDLIEHHPDLTGLFHVAGPPISKYDLLVEVRDAFGLAVELVPDDEVVIDRTLDAKRFTEVTGFVPPTWEEMVSELADDPTPYESWRS